jgi:hypothetical protein
MDAMMRRRLRFFKRLNYPMAVVLDAGGITARFPDLPGCEISANSLEQLWPNLEPTRVEWLRERILEGDLPPLPNAYLEDPITR